MPRRPLQIVVGLVVLAVVLLLAYAVNAGRGTSSSPVPVADPHYQATLRSLRPGNGTASTATFAVGETVRAELTLSNVSGSVRTEPNTVLAWYLDVYRPNGSLIHAERRTASAPGTITIQPGLPYTSQHDWGQVDTSMTPVAAGSYVLTAVCVAGSVSVPITIVPAPVPR